MVALVVRQGSCRMVATVDHERRGRCAPKIGFKRDQLTLAETSNDKITRHSLLREASGKKKAPRNFQFEHPARKINVNVQCCNKFQKMCCCCALRVSRKGERVVGVVAPNRRPSRPITEPFPGKKHIKRCIYLHCPGLNRRIIVRPWDIVESCACEEALQ